LGIAEILIGLFLVANLGLLKIAVGGPILAAGIYTYWNRGRNYRNYRRVQAVLGILLLAYAVLYVIMLWMIAANL